MATISAFRLTNIYKCAKFSLNKKYFKPLLKNIQRLRMAKIVYVGLPAHGHTNPTLPVMKELVQRGHTVLYYNAASFQEKIDPTGVDFRALPEPLPTAREIAEALRELINASLMISNMSRRLTHYLIDEFEREQPDLVIYDSIAMWGYIAARIQNIPQICFITTFVLDGSQGAVGLGTMARFFWSALPHMPKLISWRRSMARDFGKDHSGGITEYADLNIVFTSQSFHPKNNFIDGRFRFVGPSLEPSLRDGDFPFEQLHDEPKVYISLGTVHYLNTAFYRAVFKAFANQSAQFILSIGKNTDITQLGTTPNNFIVRNYVSQLAILQHVDAFITHGGMNSVHEGLYYGVPEIVVPHQFEQLLNGNRVVQTGAGLLLGNTRPYGRVTAQELRTALNTLLNNPQYQQNAQRIGTTLKEAGGYRQAVKEIETFLDAVTSYQIRGASLSLQTPIP
ncbi:MAG: glycosyl transferase [Chloroflexi bacterium AL-W]|nr:glycosyl transferase [Chloroflexi bacterium AL-N1]NOK68203.1 glycosyl transferase [Chloroflexi bacterium AL-N10]NOK73849.1 glycosyl transferase [Chloroflexi bacterium AL-N5]NOK82817.1 glycosyl transferase [Chloroflexi bacterium AL-W]NOK90339.1 glycosyl transferase [Chloroflexi bacterium AL-N15]